MVHHPQQGIGVEITIRIQGDDELPPAEEDSRVQGLCFPAVRMHMDHLQPFRMLGRKAVQNLDGLIRTAIVDNDDFIIGVVQIVEIFDNRLDAFPFVVGRDDNGGAGVSRQAGQCPLLPAQIKEKPLFTRDRGNVLRVESRQRLLVKKMTERKIY